MKKLSRFDLYFIIAFVVVTLLGGGAWWYMSGLLGAAQDDVAAAHSEFKKYSTKSNIIVSPSNTKTLEANIAVLKAQIDPLVQTKLLPKDDKLHAIENENPVAWKHDLDDMLHRLTAAAKLHEVTLPANFYFGFSRYVSLSPEDKQTAVLSKQLVGVEQFSTILINAQVKGIQSVRRTYEELPRTNTPSLEAEPDRLGGHSLNSAGNLYTAYPFEVEFETSPENLRTVLDNLIQSPCLFVVRTLTIQSSNPNSPLNSDLDKLVGPPPAAPPPPTPFDTPEIRSTEPAPPPKGPQYLFGNATLKVKARIDMIQWNGGPPEAK